MVGFPAFLNPSHKLGMFSDAAFHESCLSASPEGAEAQALFIKWQTIWESRPRDLRSVVEMDAWGKKAFASFGDGAAQADHQEPAK